MNQTEIVACIYKHVGRSDDLETLTELAEEIARMATEEERERAEASLSTYRHHLIQLAIYADKAVGVLATIEAESDEEEKKLQEIIDGLQQWAPDALREAITEPTIQSPYCTCGSEESADEEELFANRCKSCGGQLV